MKFRLEKSSFSNDPRYALEMYGLVYYFTRTEGISELREKLRGTRWDAFKQIVLLPMKNFATGKVWVNGKYRAVRYGSVRAFILIRHKYEIDQFLDRAIADFANLPRSG